MIAMEAVGRSKPDGYTILFGPGASAVAVQQKSLPFDPNKDFVPISAVVAFPFYLLVDPSKTPATSVAELIAILKKRDKVSYAAPNTLSNVGGALLSNVADLNAVAVQYKSTADAVRDLKAGLIDYAFIDAGLALAQMKSGELRGLAVSMTKRAQNAPDIPTMAELGFNGFDFHGWLGVHGPAGMPQEARDRLEKWIVDAARSDETAAFYKTLGAEKFALTSKEFADFEKNEFAAWRERAKIADLKVQ
jgi:tripartite-type tricarboxylate transporter receptor subunit TctC